MIIIIIFIYNLLFVIIVDGDEIRRLSKRFKKLDLNKNGSLSMDEFMSIPELQQNPLVKRVIDILDTDRNGEIDFQGVCVSERSLTIGIQPLCLTFSSLKLMSDSCY